jgi:hypothetical protein
MKHLVAFAALTVALAGCMSQPRLSEAEAKAKAAYAQCEELRQVGQIKTHVAAVNCAVPQVTDAYVAAAYPFTDLVYDEIQARRVGAARVDDGDVSETQYQHDVAVLDARIAAEEKRRRAEMALGGSGQAAPPEPLIAGLPSFAPAPTAAAMPPPAPGGCVPLGSIRTCQ